MNTSTSSPEFFEAKYRADRDPWNFASSASETARYDATVASLAGRRYRHGFEPACSVGVLTARLAEICDRLTAFDFSPTAAATAAERCTGLGNVQISCASLTEALPAGDVDLLVLSEVGYYFDPAEWQRILLRLTAAVAPGATLVAVHWLGQSQDHRTGGDEVHAILRDCPALRLLHEERHQGFRLDVFKVVEA